ncbi:MAG: DUF5683 domain-containing protein [Flavobacteriales bacterium]
MSFKSFLLLAVSFFVLFNGVAQDKGIFKSDTTHSPRKATIYSAVLPGLGQAYNKKYWKIPLVYAAIGGCLTAALINNRDFKEARDELIDRNNFGRICNDEFKFYNDSQLLEYSNFSRKWRDNMFIFTGVAYALNIIDANVDAHLFNFNVDKNLSMTVTPFSDWNRQIGGSAGINLRFRFR